MKNKVTAGTIKAFVFVFLVGTAIAFWLSTQRIINHVRDFQKMVVNTQKGIFLSFIDPMNTDESTINSDIFREGFLNVPFPIIWSDDDNNPIPGYWRNLGIAINDTTSEAAEKLKKIISRMDKVNPPDTVYMPALRQRTDTLTAYEIPVSQKTSLVLTDQVGNILYYRNIVSRLDTTDVLGYISKLDSIPDTFNKTDEPPLIMYSSSGEIDWPVIITKNNGKLLYWKNVGVDEEDTTLSAVSRLKEYVRFMKKGGIDYNITTRYISGYDKWLFHYGDPEFLSWILWLPIMGLSVIVILILLGFIGFRTITREEQRSIWVGMAKETAHQLGTPITSINGWLELLKTEQDVNLMNQAVSEMERDLTRLTRVVSRFSHIGSKPELQPMDVTSTVSEVMDYFRIRVPNMGKHIKLETKLDNLSTVMGNSELLNWAFENLIKNSLASIENHEGLIKVTGNMSKDFKHVILDFSDNGKGIASSEKNKIMKPGYTTKKRGWGLGLSLVKRIIEDYHGGRIYLLESQPGIGSTFRIILPSIRKEV